MILVSFDVISLFTKVPVDRAIAIAKDRLQKDEMLADRTMLTTDENNKASLFVSQCHIFYLS